MKKITTTIALFFTVSPLVTFAFERNVRGISDYIVDLISTALIPFLIALALTWFIWGVVSFIRAAENSEERKKGKKKIMWGIIALFFMIAFIGISSVFTNTFFNKNPILPQLYTNN